MNTRASRFTRSASSSYRSAVSSPIRAVASGQAARTRATHDAARIDGVAVPGFATSGDLARVVDAIAASALRLAADGSSRDESEEP